MATNALPVIKHAELNPAWLARRTEAILEPELPIVDPHHHLWNRGGGYFLDELLADTRSGHRIVATVFVQCGFGYRSSGPEKLRSVGETEFVVGIAEEAEQRHVETRVCAGIVGEADLRLGEAVDEVLAAHIEAGRGRFRGIRHITARHEAFNAGLLQRPDAQVLGDAGFRKGFARLAAFDLSFDAWLYHTQIPELTDLARAFPRTPIVLNHFGGPLGVGPCEGKRDETFREWLASIKALAACPNAHIKLGGLGMVVAGFDLHKKPEPPSSEELAALWRPYVTSAIECFGASRSMFESNFPVDKAMCSYQVLWNAFKRMAAGASQAEKAALFHDTAAKFYRLKA